MLRIRFQRVGRKNDPSFRLVVTEKRSKPKGMGVEILGSYHPKTKDIRLKSDRILYWISKGALPSDTVHNLLIRKEVIHGTKRNVAPRVKAQEKDAIISKETKKAEEKIIETEEVKKEENLQETQN